MSMIPYVVRQGDFLARLALTKGFDADEVWNDAKNAELKRLRPDPNILAPGDVLFIPAGPSGPVLQISEGAENEYTAVVPQATIRLRFMRVGGPRANEECRVEGMPQPTVLRTDADGQLSFDVPVSTRELTIVFPTSNRRYNLLVGEMDPAEEPSGIRKRLTHLGYLGHDIDSVGRSFSDILQRAVAAFQQAHALPVTGALDQTTIKAIVRAHGR